MLSGAPHGLRRIIDPVISRPVCLVRNPSASLTRACAAIEKATPRVAAEMLPRGIWEGDPVEADA